MIKILSFFFGFAVSGTVDQIHGHTVVAELVVKDGHIHDIDLPIWLFPCRVREGTRFIVNHNIDSTVLFCEK
jgi:hypothetical protein